MNELRVCRICHIEKPISEFPTRKSFISKDCGSCNPSYYRMRKGDERRDQCKFYVGYQSRAERDPKKRGFTLTFEQFVAMWNKPCHYCGDRILNIGIDRIDSDLGYTVENTVPCCVMCNRMKRDYGVQMFLNQCRDIAKHSFVLTPDS